VAHTRAVSKPNSNASDLEKQDLPCVYLFHHQLERANITFLVYLFMFNHHCCLLYFVQDRDVDEGDEQWSLSRFAPLMQEVLEDLAANKLNFDEYPYVQPPSNDSGNSSMLYDDHPCCRSPGDFPGANGDKAVPNVCALQ